MTYPTELAEQIISLRRQNKTVDEIAEIVGKTATSLRCWLSRRQINKRDNKLEIIDQMTNEELAYFAGIIDGEGSIIISKLAPNKKKGEINNRYQLYVKVCNTDRRLIEWLSEKTLTNLNKDRRYKNKSDLSRDTYSIHWPVVISLYLLQKIYQYLVIKKEQVDLALKFRKTFDEVGNCIVPKRILKQREKMYLEMKALHKREF